MSSSSRRQNRASTLAIVLPHPPLLRRPSSLLSQSSITSPHTPNCGSSPRQSWLFTNNNNNNNRRSMDSWNSSNQDVGEDCDSEWKGEQILLLSRTLDSLPSHLVTPFNGPIPPSNLLDKIARGVANAKGPNEWPHSLRATRVKLIEIARQRAKEDSRPSKFVVPDENDIACYSGDSDVNVGLTRKSSRVISRRPLYRQSSMDFMNTDDRKNGDSITRLSARLQRTENLVPNPSYHPYTRSRARAQTQSQAQTTNRRSLSPPRPTHVPSLISPSSPSSSTLNTFSSISTSALRPHLMRRSGSTFSTGSSMISGNRSSFADSELEPHLLPSVLPGPVQRVRRSESFCHPSHAASKDDFPVSSGTPPPTRQTFKRAPSYGTLAQEAREKEKEKRTSGVYSQIYGSKSREEMNTSPCPSSDEEEKLRTKRAKKVKGPGGKPSQSPTASSGSPDNGNGKKRAKDATCAESKHSSSRVKSPASTTAVTSSPPTHPITRPVQRMNHPGMFGSDLPHLHIPAASSRPTTSAASSQTPATSGQPRKTLRRVKRLAPSRRISFGSLVSPAEANAGGEIHGEQRPKLGSAFELS